MNIDDVLNNIEEGRYPRNPRVDIPEPFQNDAGSIWNLAHGTFGSASPDFALGSSSSADTGRSPAGRRRSGSPYARGVAQ